LAGCPAAFVRLAGCNMQCPGCFSASTVIRMADFTTRLIPEIGVGDRVLSYDKEGGRFVKRRVTAVMRHQVKSVLRLRTESNKSTYVTHDHPFLVRGKGWVLAKNLKPDDRILHLSLSELRRLNNPMRDEEAAARMVSTSRERGHYDDGGSWGKLTDEQRQKVREGHSLRMTGDGNPMKKPEVNVRQFLARKDRGKMSKLEKMVLSLGKECGLRFCGGDVIVGNKFPDFIVAGTNKLVEVWPASQTTYRGRDERWREARKALFATGGYDVLFLEVPDGIGRRGQLRLKRRIEEYARNGEVVKEVKELRMGRDSKAWTRLTGRKDAPLTVYNFEVKGTHTYVADTMVVHNCDTDYTTGRRTMTIKEIADEAIKATVGRLVVLTGGEPLRQNSVPLMDLLYTRDMDVQIETSGTAWQQIPIHATVVCSPKTPFIHPKLKEYIHAYKYVLDYRYVNPDNGLPTDTLGAPAAPAYPPPGFTKQMVFVQPKDEQDPEMNARNMEAAVASCTKYGWRLGVQLHKIARVP
jgi:7-carboxy-7-deazaguanine synthase